MVSMMIAPSMRPTRLNPITVVMRGTTEWRAMWRDRTVYDASGAADASAKGLRVAAQATSRQAEALARAAIKIKMLGRDAERGLRNKSLGVTPHG